MEDFEPSPEQVSALESRVVVQKLEPYADFSLLTPYGRRMAKALRLRSWVLQEDGSYRPSDVPGPPDFQAWAACFKVYAAALLMLRFSSGECVVKPQALEIYFEKFRSLVADHREAWHLCAQAEDRARAELMPRLRRSYAMADEDPWDKVFTACANEDRYWDREVRRPGLAFIARGGLKAAGGKAVEDKKAEGGGQERRMAVAPGTSSTSGSARKRQRLAATGANAVPLGNGASKRDHRGRFMTGRKGEPICFLYNNAGCSDPCPNGRAHICQGCLGNHPITRCPATTSSSSATAGAKKGSSERAQQQQQQQQQAPPHSGA